MHCLTKNLPRRFLDPLSISAFSYQPKHILVPKTRSILFLTAEKPQMARPGKKRKIPGEARDFGCLKGFFSKVLNASHIVTLRVITVDTNAAYSKAFKDVKEKGIVPTSCELR